MQITGYELRVKRGERAGRVYKYGADQRARASRFADRLDREYGAICCTVRPIFETTIDRDQATLRRVGAADGLFADEPERTFTCTPASIATEHEAEMQSINMGGK